MLTILMLSLSAAPQFEVTNRCPAFVVVNKTPAPAVAVPAKAKGFPYDHDHVCNACGRYVTRIAGYLPDGSHYHRCSCGNAWQHK